MTRHSAPSTRRLSRLLFGAALAASFLTTPAPRVVAADDYVVAPRPIVRKFPQGQFCALPVAVQFVAPTTAVILTFEAQVFVDDGFGNLVWTEQNLDNITLATSATVAANFGPPPAGGSSENCYIGDPSPVSYFHFNAPGLTLALLERCDDDPAARGWTYAGGAGFNPNRSAPRDVDTDSDLNLGSIALGQDSASPAGTEIATASVLVSGLTVGESYDLGAWWDANFVRFPHDLTYLTVSVSTLPGTPVVRKSWGAVKTRYH